MDMIAPEITRDIYPMPAFVTLAVPDVARTVDWYVTALGFVSLFTMPGSDAEPVLVHLRRWRYQDILVRPGSPAGPIAGAASEGWTLSVMANVEELDALANRARAHGGGNVTGPYDTAWNTRDVRTVDPDGHPLVFTARRPVRDRDDRFSATITELAGRQGLAD
jgi:uncharacterized glyoxalase superfamily protein PhnB